MLQIIRISMFFELAYKRFLNLIHLGLSITNKNEFIISCTRIAIEINQFTGLLVNFEQDANFPVFELIEKSPTTKIFITTYQMRLANL